MASINDRAKTIIQQVVGARQGIVAFGLRYHKMVTLCVTFLVAFGIYALKMMDKNEFPSFTVREGLVVAVCPGASSQQMSEEVLKKLEDYIFSYKEVDKKKTHSRCTSGMVIVFVELDNNVGDTDQFWNKFQIDMSTAKAELPKSVLAVETLTSFGDTSSLLISISSADKTYRELSDITDRLKDRLRAIESIGEMEVVGKQKEQIAIYVDNERLTHYGIKASTLALQLFNQGFNTTGGELKGEWYTSPIYMERPVNSVADVERMIVFSTPEGNVVRVGDIARVVKEYPKAESYITNNGVKSLLLSISIKDGHNVVVMGEKVNEVMAQFKSEIPESVELFTITDQPEVVNSSVNNFLTELLIAIVAVVVVIMLLLPISVALIAAATIPITIFISLGIFYALGIELNTVTLACLIVSLGMIVDNSVVIIDNYVELISEGMDHPTASYRSAVEFLKAIFSATCAISITFFPFLLTLTGMFRDFITDFPWALTIILFVSLCIAELLVPYLQVRLIKKPIYKLQREAVASGKKKFSFFVSLQKWYDKLIGLSFRWPKTVLAIGILSVIVSIWYLVTAPIQLMPIAERNQFAVEIYLPTGSSLDKTDIVADSLSRMLRRDKRVVSVAVFHGCSSPRFQTTYAPQVGGPDYAQFIVNTESQAATVDLLNEYTPLFESYFPEAYCRFKQLSYSSADYPIEVRVHGQDYTHIQHVADTILEMMHTIPGLRLIRPDSNTPLIAAKVEPDVAKASRMGLSNLFTEATLAMRYSSGLPIATVWEGDYGLDVVVKSDKATRSSVSQLRDEQIPVMEVASTPLSQFAEVKPEWNTGLIGHYNGIPTITLIAENERGFNALQLNDEIAKQIKGLDLPEDVTITYGGDYEETFTYLPSILVALVIAVVIIFFILLLHYKQVGVAFILLASLLLTLPGMVLGLIIMDLPISLTVTLGLISLMGILVRNAIIMIDYAEQIQAQEHLDNCQASLQSAKRRMRPIFLTSSAATMGVLPMVISTSGLWQPMGTVIFFGTPLTMVYILVVIPIALWKFSGKSGIVPPFGPPTPHFPLDPTDPANSGIETTSATSTPNPQQA
ncbi:MAG: efflux RND transporter permease subunit [Bacteroidales bacterium]|nr:efflux RND transporter permease subunit [Bacteroidales bacterium]